jgi:protocatechuate 3,4-dioxygenase, beta subunit
VTTDLNRRHLLLGLAGALVGLPSLVMASRLQPTPAQPAGPFYPLEPPLDDDNDLTRVTGRTAPALGEITDLGGHILNANGEPLSGLRIEIWQCDANGRYRHPHDHGGKPRDEGFQGHGHTITDAQGRYRFRTIRPVAYPGRAPHIHVAVFSEGMAPFVTQIYVKGEPQNAGDFLFQPLPADRRPLVLADFVPETGGDARLTARFDLILGGGGTPAA